jgi:hypothetical protein
VKRFAVCLIALAGCAGTHDSTNAAVSAADDEVDAIAYTKNLPVEEAVSNWDARFGPLPSGCVAAAWRVVLPDYGIDSRVRFTISWECEAERPVESSVAFMTDPVAPDAIGPWSDAPPIVTDPRRGEKPVEWQRIRLRLSKGVRREIRGFLDSSAPADRERAGGAIARELFVAAFPGSESAFSSFRIESSKSATEADR